MGARHAFSPSARVARRAVRLKTGRDVQDRSSRRTPCAAPSLPVLRRPHDHHRDLCKGLPAETPPRARCSSDQDRHLVMPHHRSTSPVTLAILAGSASIAAVYRRSINRPAMTLPTLSWQRPLRSFGPSPTPILRGKAIGAGALNNLAQPNAAAKSP